MAWKFIRMDSGSGKSGSLGPPAFAKASARQEAAAEFEMASFAKGEGHVAEGY
jgi:hypothetical protein